MLISRFTPGSFKHAENDDIEAVKDMCRGLPDERQDVIDVPLDIDLLGLS
jgi:hypothetical protein